MKIASRQAIMDAIKAVEKGSTQITSYDDPHNGDKWWIDSTKEEVMKVFSCKEYLKEHSPEWRLPEWAKKCEGLTKEQINAAGYVTDDDWMIERKVDMTKDDLRDGMYVRDRDGEFHKVEICFMRQRDDYPTQSSRINNDLTDTKDSAFDIIKVYDTHQNVIWQREEKKEMTLRQVCDALGYDIKIIKG